MNKTIRIQYQTADGIKMYARADRNVLRSREIYRTAIGILRIDGEERPTDHISAIATKRRYRLWTQLKNGTFVFLEENTHEGTK